jgi:hypothetical protein
MKIYLFFSFFLAELENKKNLIMAITSEVIIIIVIVEFRIYQIISTNLCDNFINRKAGYYRNRCFMAAHRLTIAINLSYFLS